MSNNDIFWANNIMVLFENNEITNFLPNNEMTPNQKLNSIVRFGLYLSIMLIFLKRNYLYFYIFIFSLLITYFIKNYGNEEKNELNFNDYLHKTKDKLINDIKDLKDINNKTDIKPLKLKKNV